MTDILHMQQCSKCAATGACPCIPVHHDKVIGQCTCSYLLTPVTYSSDGHSVLQRFAQQDYRGSCHLVRACLNIWLPIETSSRPTEAPTPPQSSSSSLLKSCSRENTDIGNLDTSTHRTAIAATSEESKPPDNRTPNGASDISRFTTAATKESCVWKLTQLRTVSGAFLILLQS